MPQSNAFKFANNILTNGGYDAADLVGAVGGPTAGQVIQVVTATDATERSTLSTSFVVASNTLSVSITPSSASNKIFVIANSVILADSRSYYTIFRGATNIGDSTYGLSEHYPGDGSNYIITNLSMSILDSPSTTSSTTYEVRFKDSDGSGTSYLNYRGIKASITCFEIKV